MNTSEVAGLVVKGMIALVMVMVGLALVAAI